MKLMITNELFVERWIQKFVTPAQYWHDPLDEDLYKRSSVFLADINNEMVISSIFLNHSVLTNFFFSVCRLLTKLTRQTYRSLKIL